MSIQFIIELATLMDSTFTTEEGLRSAVAAYVEERCFGGESTAYLQSVFAQVHQSLDKEPYPSDEDIGETLTSLTCELLLRRVESTYRAREELSLAKLATVEATLAAWKRQEPEFFKRAVEVRELIANRVEE